MSDENSPPGGQPAGKPGGMRRAVTASFIGATFEWFDFGLYGTSAAIVFNEIFFTQLTPLVGTFAAFTTAAVGYFARPLGGLVFGHFGDRLGRKSMLVTTMLIMGVATVAIGLLPTYQMIGLWAPVLLLVARICQGIGLGGEYAGAALTTLESAPRPKRGFFGSLPQVGNPAGALLATLLVAAFTSLPGDAYVTWGWRMPFLLSAVLLVTGLYARLRLMEPTEFAAVKRTGGQVRFPLVEVIRSCPRNLMLGLGARSIDAIAGNVFGGLALAYGVTVIGMERDVVLFGHGIAVAVEIAYIPLVGWLANRVSRQRIYMTGVVLIALFAFPFFMALSTGSTALVWIMMGVALVFGSGTEFAVQSTLLSEVFPTHLRYTAISAVYQLTATIGGLSNLAATALLLWMDGDPWLIAALLIVVALIALVCTAKLRQVEPTASAVTVGRVDAEPSGAGHS